MRYLELFTGLKNMNCANYNATETYKSREMLVNYFFHRSDSSLHNTTLSECTAECRLRKYRCAVAVLMDQSCDRYLSSASYSYGSVLAVGKNTRTAMQICPTGISSHLSILCFRRFLNQPILFYCKVCWWPYLKMLYHAGYWASSFTHL